MWGGASHEEGNEQTRLRGPYKAREFRFLKLPPSLHFTVEQMGVSAKPAHSPWESGGDPAGGLWLSSPVSALEAQGLHTPVVGSLTRGARPTRLPSNPQPLLFEKT